MKTLKFNILRIFILLIASAAVLSAAADDWKLHPTFDKFFGNVIDTPDKVYVQAYATDINTSTSKYSKPFPTLFVYDKGSGEFESYNARNYLSATIATNIYYNSRKGYLLIVYDDGNIDLLTDKGKVYNIPGLAMASLNSSRRVNDVTFDADNDRAYIATDFGYLVINDKRHEIAESHIYNTPVLSAGRSGDCMILLTDKGIYASPMSDPHLSMDSFTLIDENPARAMMPLDDGRFAFRQGGNMMICTPTPSSATIIPGGAWGNFSQMTENRDGYFLVTPDIVFLLSRAGTVTNFRRNDSFEKLSSWDGTRFFTVNGREGIAPAVFSQDTLTATGPAIFPNSPSEFHSTAIIYHPNHGMIVGNHGLNMTFPDREMQTPVLFCGLKNGEWSHLSPAYLNPEFTNVAYEPMGLTLDPDDNRYVFSGSMLNGILRLNLSDPDDIVLMSRPNDPHASMKGFTVIAPVLESDPDLCCFAAPKFDRQGNLWTLYFNYETPSEKILRMLPAASRKAGKWNDWVTLSLPSYYEASKGQMILPLTSSTGKDMLVIANNAYDGELIVVDTSGTPADSSDDKYYRFDKPADQDGTSIGCHYIYTLYEDPQTGYVWIGNDNGVFYFNPANVASKPNSVTRVKVARNDGTSLADYLLNGISVFGITTDTSSRKWFATGGGGVTATTADGRNITHYLTAENSYLPHNDVFGIGYDPSSNSVLLSTEKGIAQYFPGGTASEGGNNSEVKIYPNPVRPDYLGWINIEGLPDNALVKITDSSGSLVKELGIAEGGAARWDGCNLRGERVATGVYIIFATGTGDDSGTVAGKVMIVK